MKNIFLCSLMLVIFASCTSTQFQQVLDQLGDSPLTNAQIGSGLKEALTQGISSGVNLTSKKDGFFKNPKIKIPWPENVRKAESALRGIGLGGEVDKVVLSLNRAAEDAAVSAKPIFVGAIKSLTFNDVMGILKGEKNAATNFLRRTTSDQLVKQFRPSISKSLDKVNGTKHWGDVIGQYNKIPLVKKVNSDLPDYVTGEAISGLFTMVEKEEARIRENPVARTTDLLKKVFKLQD